MSVINRYPESKSETHSGGNVTLSSSRYSKEQVRKIERYELKYFIQNESVFPGNELESF